MRCSKLKNYNSTYFLILPLGGILGGIFAYFIEIKILQYIGEYRGLQLDNFLISGLLMGIMIMFLSIMPKYMKKIQPFHFALLALILIGLFLGLYFIENTIFSWIFLVLSFAIWIYMVSNFFYSLGDRPIIKHAMNIIGAYIGGVAAAIFVCLAFVLRINFSIDEGYFLLTTLLMSLIGATIGVIIIMSAVAWNLTFKNEANLFSENISISKKRKIAPSFIIFLLLLITAFNYWETMGLNEVSKLQLGDNYKDIFICSNLSTANEINDFTYNKSEIVKFLENKPKKRIDMFAILYLLSNNDKYAQEFKNALLNEAKNQKFIGISGSVKAWQYEAMIRAYYYLLLTEKNPLLFNESEKELILEWFKKINEQVFKISWVDCIYGFLFKKIPDGPYENQEIGTGLLAVLSEVLKEKYPDLSERDIEYINNFGVGWRGNFRNPDDGIVYHQQVWIKNAYMMAKYGGQNEYLLSNNSRNSFEWILLQWPPNGMSPAYNIPAEYTPFDIMVMGAYLFNDGRYLWLAERMLDDEVKNINREIDYIVGLEYWNDSLIPVKPTVGSCYIKGTTGIAQRPGPVKPDKIVFRDGWDNDSLYALLNLRFYGWHSYKATNAFISIMYGGQPFVVEELPLKHHSWLPKAKADSRDKKIDRTMLNGFQIEKTGLERIIYEITGFGSLWSQDPPKFAELITFNSTSFIDYAITRILDWHGWTHDRVSVLVKGDYFIVLDHAKGDNKKKVALTWHLKGNIEFTSNGIKLTQGNHSLFVYYPHLNGWYRIKIVNNTKQYPSAGDIHDPDLDFWMITENKSEIAFITLFYPEKENVDYKLEKIEVLNNKTQLAYPKALGIKIIRPNQTDIMGVSFVPGEFVYENIKTNAEIFILRENPYSWNISFYNATFFGIKSDNKPSSVRLNEIELIYGKDWYYSENVILIAKTDENQGMINIEFDSKDVDRRSS